MGFSLKFVCKIASNEQNVRHFCSLLAICAVFSAYRMIKETAYRMMTETETLTGSSICFFQAFNHSYHSFSPLKP